MDHATRSRLAGVRVGGAAYATFLAPLAAAIAVGASPLPWTGFFLLASAASAATLAFHAAIRHGWTRRLRDPGLTAPQILTSAALTLLMMKHAGEARSILLMLAFCGLMFGMYTLRLRVMLGLVAAILSGYAGLMLLPEWSSSTRQNVVELLRFATLACVLVATALFASHAGRLRHRLKQMAMKDELTGAYNRRYLMEQLRREQERCNRAGGLFAVAILDLDHFKQINDRHGHECGDQVLQGFSSLLAGELRGCDSLVRAGSRATLSTVGRLGGEEFMLILPDCDHAGAQACLERLLACVARTPIHTDAGTVGISFSAGYAVHRHGDCVASHLLGRADQALYRAKAGGRACVESETVPAAVARAPAGRPWARVA